MPLYSSRRIFFFSFFIFLFISVACAENNFPFQGIVNSDNINIRSDSTPNAEIICSANKENTLDVVTELYGWYKIKLPKNAPSFIKKAYVFAVKNPDTLALDNKTAVPVEEIKKGEVSSERVNIRLEPSQSSVILGMVNKGEIINILEDRGLWYKIEPTPGCFGWINSKFVDRPKEKGPYPQKEAAEKGALN